MISVVQPLPVGDAMRVWMNPPASATRIRLLRKENNAFTGYDDPDALVVSDGKERVVTDFSGVMNGVEVFYKAFYRINGSWIGSNVKEGTPETSFVDQSVDPMSLLRERLELGLRTYVTSGAIQHASGYIPVLTASPLVENAPLPIVTVHLETASPEMRSIGEVAATDVFDEDAGVWLSFEGSLARADILIMIWSLNSDERIALRNAAQAILLANLPVLDAAGIVLPTWTFSDMEDFQTYSAPMYQAMGRFSCYAPALVQSETAPVSDIVFSIQTTE